MTYYRA